MADVAKNKRSQALSNFTRTYNTLTPLLNNANAPPTVVNPQFAKFQNCWEKLEAAQDVFIEHVTGIDVDRDPNGVKYLDEPGDRYSIALNSYTEYLKKREENDELDRRRVATASRLEEDERLKAEAQDRKVAEEQLRIEELNARFESAKARFTSLITVFKETNSDLEDTLDEASCDDKRRVLNRLESEFKDLQAEWVAFSSIDSSKDISDMKTIFTDDVRTVFSTAQKWLLSQLKDSSDTSGGVPSVSSVVSAKSSSASRKETIHLPKFSGDEQCSPYLQYPTWKKRWDLHIVDYEEKNHAGLLHDHLDEVARSKLVGWELDYETMMKRLDTFYGDNTKVIKCVLNEVMSQTFIVEGDYDSLISYCAVLENNYNRLLNLQEGLEHEMSNSSAMAMILHKFPRMIRENWEEHLIKQESGVKLKPFNEFIAWLSSKREVWERMASTQAAFHGDGDLSFYGNVSEKTCYQCGKVGHLKRDCPDSQRNRQRDLGDTRKTRDPPKVKKFHCALHRDNTSRFCSSSNCQELRQLDPKERLRLVKENKDCSHCCGDHKPDDCRNKERVCGGGKNNRGCAKQHKVHELFCLEAKVFAVQYVHSSQSKQETVLLLIMTVRTVRYHMATVFFDTGCILNFVRDEFAKQCGFRGRQETLCVTTLGGVVTEYKTVMAYSCCLFDENGEMRYFEAYGMSSITGTVSKVGLKQLKRLFPNSSDQLLRKLERGSTVDVLIGLGQTSWHPKRVEKAGGGGDLWIHRGIYGPCVGGRHPDIREETSRSKDLFFVNHVYLAIESRTATSSSHELEFCQGRLKDAFEGDTLSQSNLRVKVGCVPPESVISSVPESHVLASNNSRQSVMNSAYSLFGSLSNPPPFSDQSDIPTAIKVVAEGWIPDVSYNCVCGAILTSPFGSEDLFFKADSLGTIVEPRCGDCKCSKCPVPGSLYSFREQQEYDVIWNNLFRKEGVNRWWTQYPWKETRDLLPKNDKAALRCLLALEKMLKKHPEKAEAICAQIEEMVERGAAIIIPKEELDSWTGAYHYLPIVLVKGKRFRICFDASRDQCGYPAFNKHLLKGPDRFVNNIAAVIIGFRNGRAAAVADLNKFHNQVYLVDEDVHMQRFLWRGLDTDIPPKVYAVSVNNFGVKSANCIATCALHKSADSFSHIYPIESQEIKTQIYVDDELIAAPTSDELHTKTARMDEICNHAGMHNKGWTYSGDSSCESFSIGDESGVASEKVLGLLYSANTDSFSFNVTLRFMINSKEVVITTLEELEKVIDELIMCRRSLTSNVARIFDPVGFLCAILLQAKVLMREMWANKDLGWDDPIPKELAEKWLSFLSSLLSLGELTFPRSLWPDAEVEGLPMLIVFSDGSVLAFGAVAYIQWKLKHGGFWTRIIMAKCKIAPKNIVSIPRMELNGAVLGNRIKNFILKETNITFSKVYQFVDSSTVLGYAQKEYGAFQPYEGIRIAELQSTNEFDGNKLKGFAWVAGTDNPADWCTKPRRVDELRVGGFMEAGPVFLRQEEELWPIKFTYKKEDFEGMVKVPKPVYCAYVEAQIRLTDFITRLVVRCSSWNKMNRTLAWMLRALVFITYSSRYASDVLSCREIAQSKRLLLKHAQKDCIKELLNAANNGKGPFRKFAPLLGDDGIWRVGSRVRQFVPFTFDHKPPVILPNNHKITLLLMREAHLFGHPGQDGTLSRFRARGYWTTRGSQLAKRIKSQCIPCRKTNHTTMSQQMGELPEDLLQHSYAWGYCQLDLFGYMLCRGDVNPRTTKKIWGMLIEDVNSGAVYIDVVDDYSAHAVIMTLSRFGSLRGWPGVISSDPGSQLESASGILMQWWHGMEDSLRQFGTSKNFEWKLSPADSPWRQGKAERRIGIVKKLISHSIGDSRLTPLELQTSLFNIANICNERPLGLSKPHSDGSYTLITPNQLLLGRSLNTCPDDAGLAESLPMKARFRLVRHVTEMFWKRWSTHVSPALIIRQKWHEKSRNLRVGDLVMICEDSKVKSKYKMGVVAIVKESVDGVVRSATVRYCNIQHNPQGEDDVSTVHVTRSVQRLALIMPVEEMSQPVVVKDYAHCVKCVVQL